MNFELRFSNKKLKVLIFLSAVLALTALPAFFDSKKQAEEGFYLIKKPDLKTPEYLTIQSNSFLPISNLFLGGNNFKRERFIREVTAYYPVPWETDEDPCISASGMNICKTTKKICASNEFPFGTKLLIAGEIWEVQDRMNPKYHKIIDLFFKDKESMKRWGKRTVEVIKIN